MWILLLLYKQMVFSKYKRWTGIMAMDSFNSSIVSLNQFSFLITHNSLLTTHFPHLTSHTSHLTHHSSFIVTPHLTSLPTHHSSPHSYLNFTSSHTINRFNSNSFYFIESTLVHNSLNSYIVYFVYVFSFLWNTYFI